MLGRTNQSQKSGIILLICGSEIVKFLAAEGTRRLSRAGRRGTGVVEGGRGVAEGVQSLVFASWNNSRDLLPNEMYLINSTVPDKMVKMVKTKADLPSSFPPPPPSSSFLSLPLSLPPKGRADEPGKSRSLRRLRKEHLVPRPHQT